MLIETPDPANHFKEILQALPMLAADSSDCFFFEARSCWQTAVLVGVNVLDRLGQQCHSLDMTDRLCRCLGRKNYPGGEGFSG